jgi:hypothetical protein
MKYKNILMLIAVFMVIGTVVSYGLAAKAEDDSDTGNESSGEIQQRQDEANFELQKQQMEAAREAEKKALENSPEAVKKAAENRWEADKEQFEANREAEKKSEESASAEASDGDENQNEDEDEDAAEHRSVVSAYVHDLLSIASTTGDRGLGEKVREIAKEQNENKDKVARAIDDVKSRNAFITFLIGADFKNLGELRSFITTTDNHINRLNDIKSKASSTPEIQAALDVEIDSLSQEKERLSGIVAEKEDKISLFGWLVKLFQK